jgi:hypothetical protein
MIVKDKRNLDLEFFFYDNVGSRVKPTRNPEQVQAFLETALAHVSIFDMITLSTVSS